MVASYLGAVSQVSRKSAISADCATAPLRTAPATRGFAVCIVFLVLEEQVFGLLAREATGLVFFKRTS